MGSVHDSAIQGSDGEGRVELDDGVDGTVIVQWEEVCRGAGVGDRAIVFWVGAPTLVVEQSNSVLVPLSTVVVLGLLGRIGRGASAVVRNVGFRGYGGVRNRWR